MERGTYHFYLNFGLLCEISMFFLTQSSFMMQTCEASNILEVKCALKNVHDECAKYRKDK